MRGWLPVRGYVAESKCHRPLEFALRLVVTSQQLFSCMRDT